MNSNIWGVLVAFAHVLKSTKNKKKPSTNSTVKKPSVSVVTQKAVIKKVGR